MVFLLCKLQQDPTITLDFVQVLDITILCSSRRLVVLAGFPCARYCNWTLPGADIATTTRWAAFDAVVNVTQDEYAGMAGDARYLQVPVAEGKRDKVGLVQHLPAEPSPRRPREPPQGGPPGR